MDSGQEPMLTTYNILLKGFFRARQVKEDGNFSLNEEEIEEGGIRILTGRCFLYHGGAWSRHCRLDQECPARCLII